VRIASSVLDLMRESPLVALRGRRTSPPRAQLWAKLDLALAGGMKDRVALKIVEEAERAGDLRPGGVIAESSSGTMAEGLARVGALKGYRVIIVTDPRIDPLTAAKLRCLGVELIVVDECHPTGGWQLSRLRRLRQVLAEHPTAFWSRQYDNPNNAGAYEQAMAGELLAALDGNLAALVGAVGSGGSLSGTARGLRRQLPDLQVIAVDAVGSVQFNQPNAGRLQSGHGNSIIAGNIDYRAIDEVHWLSDAEAFHGCRELARREGIFAGGSSGAVYVVASWVARQLLPGQQVVAIMPDRGDRYAATIFSDAYFDEHGLGEGEAPAEPAHIRYGVDVARAWSRAPLPHDGGVPYYAPGVETTHDIARELGLE
jgi:cysteine synthase